MERVPAVKMQHVKNMSLVCRHLPKCFDNVHHLEFRKDEAGDPTKGAIGMYSGKYTPLFTPIALPLILLVLFTSACSMISTGSM